MAIRKSSISGIPKGNTDNRPSSPSIGDLYYNGTLTVLEIYNGTSWVPCSAAPGTPSIATPTDASTGDAWSSTAGKLSIVFTAASNGGSVSTYNAFTTSGGFSGSSSSNTVTVSGLTPGTAYTIYGSAQNSFGTSGNTSNSASVTPTTLPQVRTIGTATTSPTSTDVTVTWTNGNDGGKPLTSITITPFLNGTTAGTPQTASSTSATSHTFTGLIIGNSYTFKVKATNANGTCADSSATNSVTIPPTVTEFNATGVWTPVSYPATYKAYLIGAGGSSGVTATASGPYSRAVSGGGGGGGGGYYGETNLTTINTGSVVITVGASVDNSNGGTTTVGNTNAAGGNKGSNGIANGTDPSQFNAGAGGNGGSGGGGGARWKYEPANNQYNQLVEAGGNGGSGGGTDLPPLTQLAE